MDIDLNNLPKEENHQIPEDYFNNLPGQVMHRIRKEKKKRRIFQLSGIAAALAIVICGTFVYKTVSPDAGQQPIVNEKQIEETQSEETTTPLEQQMVDYYSSDFARMEYYNF